MTESRLSAALKRIMRPVGMHLVLICALAFLALMIFRTPGHAALFWPANGVMLALLLRTGRPGVGPILLLSGGASAVGLLLAGVTPVNAILGSACNVAEAALAALLLHRVVGTTPELTRFRDLMIFVTVSVVVPAVSGVAATGLLVGYARPDAVGFLEGWWLANSLGLLIVTPIAMTIRLTEPSSAAAARPGWMTPLALAAVLAVAVADSLFPVGAASIGGLAVLALIGAEYGAAFAAAALLLVSSAAIACRLVGGSLADIPSEQAWLAAQSLVVLALSSLLAEQRRLQAELAVRLGQSEAARLVIADSDRLARLAGAVAEIGYWRTDFNTGQTLWSDEMLAILGLSQDGPRGGLNIQTAIQTCVVPADQAEMFRLSEVLRRDGEAWATQVRIERQSDGASRLLSLRGEPELSPEGAVTAVLCVGRDITAEAEARTALEESEARYRLVTEHMHDPVLHLALDGTIRFVSSGVRRYGYDPQDLVGTNAINYYHPDDLPGYAAFLELLLGRESLEGAEFNNEFRIRIASGEYVWVEGKPALLHDADGRIDGYVNGLRDITSRKQAEAALQDSELRYRTIAERVTDIIAVTAMDGTFRYLSPAIEAATGYAPEALVGDIWLRHVHPEDRAAATAAYLAIGRGDSDAATEIRYRVRRRDASWVWLESRPVPQRGDDGRLDSFIDVIRDVSRNVELETDLRAAKAAAERAALAKSEFLANMSHEIRTPLTAVLGFVGVVSDRTDLPPDTRLDLERIDHAGRTLLSIVNDILEVSKLDAGQVKIERAPCDVRRLTADLIDMFAPQAAVRGLSLSLHVADAVPKALRLDGDRVRQVAVNLIGNALKFTEVGTIRVEVDYAAADGHLVVRVRDTGPGLDAQQTAGLFQRFSQVDTSVTRRQGGTGLGLAICRGLVEAMDGNIAVDSSPGAGACFHFRIPAAPCAPLSRVPVVQPDFAGDRLLVVDDNASNRDLAARIFVNLGFRVDVTSSGLEGVAASARTAYDLILMDIRMPEVDGPTAARMIRDGGGLNSQCPILAFTADVDAGLDQRYPGLFDGMVRKPIEPAQLISALASCLPAPPVPLAAPSP